MSRVQDEDFPLWVRWFCLGFLVLVEYLYRKPRLVFSIMPHGVVLKFIQRGNIMPCRRQFLTVSILGLAVLIATGCPGKLPPRLHCGVGRASVIEGNSIELTVQASQPGGDSDELTFTWSASHGRVSGSSLDPGAGTSVSASASFDATGLKPGMYQVTAEVDNRKFQRTCTIDITVETNKQSP